MILLWGGSGTGAITHLTQVGKLIPSIHLFIHPSIRRAPIPEPTLHCQKVPVWAQWDRRSQPASQPANLSLMASALQTPPPHGPTLKQKLKSHPSSPSRAKTAATAPTSAAAHDVESH